MDSFLIEIDLFVTAFRRVQVDDHFIARRKAHTEGGGHDHHHHHGNGFNYYVGRFVLKVRGSVFIPVNNIEEVKLRIKK